MHACLSASFPPKCLGARNSVQVSCVALRDLMTCWYLLSLRVHISRMLELRAELQAHQ